MASRDQQLRTNTIIVHNLSPEELKYIRWRLSQVCFQRLPLNPLSIFTIAIGMLSEWQLLWIKSATHDVLKPLLAATKLETGEIETANIDIEKESAKALFRQYVNVRQLSDVQLIVSCLNTFKSWCKDFNTSGTTPEQQKNFKTAGVIIENQLRYINDTLKTMEIEAKTTLSYTQAYKQSVIPPGTSFLHEG
jgi:hypothetical protein